MDRPLWFEHRIPALGQSPEEIDDILAHVYEASPSSAFIPNARRTSPVLCEALGDDKGHPSPMTMVTSASMQNVAKVTASRVFSR